MAGSHSTSRVLCVTAVKFFDDVHAFDDLAEGSEAGFDVVACGVVAEVDVDLGGSGVGAGVGEGDEAWGVVLLEWVIRDGDVALLLRDCGIAVDAELHPAAGDDAEKTGVVEVLCADQFIETIGTVRGPDAMGFDDEAACSGFELHAEDFGGLVVPDWQSEQEADEELSHVLQSSLSADVDDEFLLFVGTTDEGDVENKGATI
jgi:hypothetical protein